KVDPRLLAEGMKQLSGLTKSSNFLGRLGKHLDPGTLAALGKGALTPEQLEALSRSLAKGKGDEAEALARLHKAGLLDPGALERPQRAAEPDAAALASLLKEKGGSRALTQMLAKGEKSPGGRGGAGADLAWKKAPPDEAGRFKPEALPPAELGALKKMALGAA